MKNILNKRFILVAFIAIISNFQLFAQQNAEINNVILKKRAFNKQVTKTSGYKIQLYNGNEGKAYSIRDSFKSKYPYYVKVSYKAPDFKVQVGNFRTRLEADRALNHIKKSFAGAFVLKTAIHI